MSAAYELHRTKRWATWLLVAVTLAFAGSHLLPPVWWAQALKATMEAAMVGALADWFAVSALFRRIPLPVVGRHTDIIARNKDRIGQNLAQFVRDRFLDAPSLIALMRRTDPAQWLAEWLAKAPNTQVMGQQLARLLGAGLELVQDQQVERWLTRALRSVVAQVDWGGAASKVLAGLTHDGRHQAVLDDVLVRVSGALRQESTRQWMADTLVLWLKREHPLKEKVLPTDWLGDKAAHVLADALDTLLAEVATTPAHPLRQAFDRSMEQLVERLQSDPQYRARLARVQAYVLHDENLARYLRTLWVRARNALQADVRSEHSWVARKMAGVGRWLGQSLAQDAGLRQSMNARLERWVQALAPDVSQFIARHIQDTVQRWNAQELAELVEQHIGKDLQYIRINGTVVGGGVGLLLFVASHWV